MVPFVEVSHLPSSSSFYSAVLQPLGIYCISPTPTRDKELQASVAYGLSQFEILLEVRQSENPLKSPRVSSLTLSAPTRASVTAFYRCWLKADPPTWSPFRDNRGLERVYNDRQQALEGPWTTNEDGVPVTQAFIYDHVGNRLEVKYHGSSSRRNRGKASVLGWDFDIQENPLAKFVAVDSPFIPRGFFPMTHFQSLSSTSTPSSTTGPVMTSATSQDSDSLANPRESSRTTGLNTQTVVGALLGAAAGAAVTYGLISGSKEEEPEKHEEVQHRSGLTRRATFTEKPVAGQYYPNRYEKHYLRSREYETPRRIPQPHLHSLAMREPYGQEDDDVEYGVDSMPAAQFEPRSLPVRGRDPARSMPMPPMPRTVEEPDMRSRKSSRGVSRSASVRSRSETRDRAPDDWDRRSYGTSRRTAPKATVESTEPPFVVNCAFFVFHTPRKGFPTVPRAAQGSFPEPGAEASTARRVPLPDSVAGSSMADWDDDSSSMASSQMTARGVPLPDSVAGTSHAGWNDNASRASSRRTARGVPLPESVAGSDWSDSTSRASSRMTARGVPLPESVAGSDWSDSTSRASSRMTAKGVPLPESVVSSDWDDNMSRASSRLTAKGVPLPESVAGSDWNDNMSRASSRMTAKGVPLPESVAGSDWNDNASRASSRMTAKGVPLPESVAGSDWHDNSSRASSRMTAKGVPLPESVAGSDWHDNSSRASRRTARGVPLPDSVADWDNASQSSSKMTAKGVPLPESVAGNSRANWDPRGIPIPRSHAGNSHADWEDSYDAPPPSRSRNVSSHADWQDARSRTGRMAAKGVPLPESRAGSSYAHSQDTRSRAPSQMTVKGARLPDGEAGTSHAPWDAHDVPLPQSHVGSSHANWDPWDVPLPNSGIGKDEGDWADDMESLAPDDSVSCVGMKSSRQSRKRH
ncbi:hypothetical protein GMORB2_1986 [Geosmithia morbida]|uniref:Uncharacterized protein n=1 Tax=Geosmithia morbida TaxID=1094350 RepID=A0A9P5CZH6_9HYPO|nr:uncharacterized protein GMORB2_1986 [Geosmithia morbida]KAF4121578.1 hypothetical protein GMORB2_1986 [Geosmithia morbida]